MSCSRRDLLLQAFLIVGKDAYVLTHARGFNVKAVETTLYFRYVVGHDHRIEGRPLALMVRDAVRMVQIGVAVIAMGLEIAGDLPLIVIGHSYGGRAVPVDFFNPADLPVTDSYLAVVLGEHHLVARPELPRDDIVGLEFLPVL